MKIKKLKEEAIIPSKREEDAGYDFYSIFEEDFKLFMPGEIFLAPTGLAFEIPKDWVLYVAERGSTGSKGISRRCGIVDSGYRGELFVALNNTSKKPVLFYKDEWGIDAFLQSQDLDREKVTLYPQKKAIAQGLLLYCPHVEIEVVEELSDSQRGEGALGSSKK